MINVYDTLKQLDYFIDNDYLKSYSTLVERHTRTKVIPRLTNKHHIIPRCWFKLKHIPINNELSNLVNLPYREHILAHYYLCLCTVDPFKYANELALECLLNNRKLSITDKRLLENLPLYNNIYEDYMSKLKSNFKIYLPSEE